MGKLIVATFNFNAAAGSAITGEITLNLPVTVNRFVSGSALLTDAAVATYMGMIFPASTTQVLVRTFQTSGAYPTVVALSSTIPFTWGTGDAISASIMYIAV